MERVKTLSRPPRAARARTSAGAGGASTSGCATLDAIVAQLRAAGLHVRVDPEEYPNGRFAQVQDAEGNAIQMWEA